MIAPQPAWMLLEQLSKAALLDIVYDLVSQRCECADNPDPAELARELKAAIEPVLAYRGDPMPRLVARALESCK